MNIEEANDNLIMLKYFLQEEGDENWEKYCEAIETLLTAYEKEKRLAENHKTAFEKQTENLHEVEELYEKEKEKNKKIDEFCRKELAFERRLKRENREPDEFNQGRFYISENIRKIIEEE